MDSKFTPLQGKVPISFKRLMALKKTGDDVFESLTAAWPPAPFQRAFGGHVYAQAMYAASRTVEKGLVVHSMTGYFNLPGAIDVPFVYRIRRLRDGGIYCLRSVDVYQQSNAAGQGSSPCFTATISFKRSEKNNRKWRGFEHQNVSRHQIRKEYASVLDGLRPQDHPLAPGADSQWWEEQEAERWNETAAAFPGVEMRKVNMHKYNGVVERGGGKDGQGASRWRALYFYRLIQDEEDTKSGEIDLNLHAAAHLYASDRNSLFLVQRALGYEYVPTTMASLSHTVVFHGLAEHLCMLDEQGPSKWFVQEAWTSHSGDNRGCHNSRLWDYASGRVIATTIQDGMLRFPSHL
ncbi:hypothetical protein RBB50_008902 [Rhinocladiella similis]